jgi:3-methylornithyl-N6-L-lysine dehydrogenase
MTRLITEWIKDLENTAFGWNEQLISMTGCGYNKLAASVSGLSEEQQAEAFSEYKVAVVPITSGLGEIESFPQSVAAITSAMGFNSFVTSATDVDGIWEAKRLGADVLFMADDNRYIALNMRNGRIGDNNEATGKGYAQLLLEFAEAECAGRRLPESGNTAVLGFGIIGRTMTAYLMEKGIVPAVYDKDPGRREDVLSMGAEWIDDAAELRKYSYILDGTSEGGWLSSEMLADDVLIAAPGIPFSLDDKSSRKLEGRYLHDMLEIGTAVMMGLALAPDTSAETI